MKDSNAEFCEKCVSQPCVCELEAQQPHLQDNGILKTINVWSADECATSFDNIFIHLCCEKQRQFCEMFGLCISWTTDEARGNEVAKLCRINLGAYENFVTMFKRCRKYSVSIGRAEDS